MKGYKRQGTTLEIDGARRLVKPSKGVRQGNPISPILFNLAMNRVLKTLPQTTGIKTGTEKLNHLAFADDVVLLAKTDTAPGLNQQTGDRARKMWSLSLSQCKEVCNSRCGHSANGPTNSDKPEHNVQKQGRRSHYDDSRVLLQVLGH